MPIKTTDRRIDESTVSRYMQLNIPGLEPGDDFKKHIQLTQFDTNDLSIIETIRSKPAEKIVIGNLTLNTDTTKDFRGEVYSILSQDESIEVVEIEPLSSTGKYNKMSVLIDRDGHTLLFDYTPDIDKADRINGRTLLHHPAGSYFIIENDGSWTFKSEAGGDADTTTATGKKGGNWKKFVSGNDNEIIKGNQISKVGQDKKSQIKGSQFHTVNENSDLQIGASQTVDIAGSSHTSIGKSRIAIIDGLDITNVAGSKETNVQGVYILSAKERILFESPTIEFRGEVVTKAPASFKEEIGGTKKIEANQVGFSSLNDITLSAGGNINQSVVGISEETITGAPPPINGIAKSIDVKLGGIDLTANSLTIPISTSMTLDFLGGVKLGGLLNFFSINPAGFMEINGTFITIGTGATEPVLLGQTHVTWAAQHTHPTGVGVSGAPIQAGDLLKSLSKTVLVKG